jgi:uroporphyrinogen-III synthase
MEAAERMLTDVGAASWAAIGPATRRVLEHAGIQVAFQRLRSSGIAIAAELPDVAGIVVTNRSALPLVCGR